MTNCDISLEAEKYREDFVNNRISRDLKKHNWLVEKLLQEKLIEKFDNVSSSAKLQEKKGESKNKPRSSVLKPTKSKSKSAPKSKKEESIVERCSKPLRSKWEGDGKQSLNVYIAKAIYNNLLRKYKYTNSHTNDENNIKKQENKTTDKTFLGDEDVLYNNINVFDRDEYNIVDCLENNKSKTNKRECNNHEYTKRRTKHEKKTAKTKQEEKGTTDKPSLGTVDDLFNNIKVFELSDKDSYDVCRVNNNLETHERERNCRKSNKNKKKSKLNQSITKRRKPSRAIDINHKNIDKNYIRRKLNKMIRKEKTKVGTINIVVGDSLTCHLQTSGNNNTNIARKIEPQVHIGEEKQYEYSKEAAQNETLPVNSNHFRCEASTNVTNEKKCKTYSVQVQTGSVTIMTKEERETLDYLKLKNLDKVSLEVLLQKSSSKPKSEVIKQEQEQKPADKINNPSELLQAFLTFCDEYKKKTDELSERISVLFASIKENEALEISNLAESIEKEYENMTQESHSMNLVLDRMIESHQNNVPSHLIPEAPNIIFTEVQRKENTNQNRYYNFNFQSPPSQQQNSNNLHQANNNQQYNLNPQIQQNLILQHQNSTSTDHQILNGQSEFLNPLFQQGMSYQQTHVPQQIKQPNYNIQKSQNYQLRCQPLYQQNWPQATPINQTNQYPQRKQTLEQFPHRATTINTNWLPSAPAAISRQQPGQGWSSIPSSQFPTQPAHNLQRPNVLLPHNQNWRVNRTVF